MSRTPDAAPSLRLDPEREVDRIVGMLRSCLRGALKRRGFVVAMSGGVDSSVCAALAARACGAALVIGLALPERDSESESLSLAREWARTLDIEFVVNDITPILQASGCYLERDAAIRRLVPDYGDGWRCKVVVSGAPATTAGRLNVFDIVTQSPDGERTRVRIPPDEYRTIVAATNFKQRTRTMLEYYHADVRHFAVVSTPNRQEYDQGFFVKGGDGLGDVKPIAHLYKTQVYQLAEYLGVPEDIRRRTPTTDTYSLPQTQEEFFFSLPHEELDLVLYAYNERISATTVAQWLGRPPEQIERAFVDVARKRRTTAYLHMPPFLVEPICGVGTSALESI
jgi:NAD+ synthase